ncbi:tetratricopeptide repeat protein [Campylobacter coli]
MYRNLLFVLIGFFLTACGASKTIIAYPDYKQQKSNEFDLRIMKAYNYEYFNQYEEARDEFLALFRDYNITNFLENAFLLTLANNLDKKEEINNIAKPYLDKSDNLKRLSALYALNSYNLKEAQELIQGLLKKKSDDPRNLELYGDVLIRQNNLKDAIKYYQLAYNQVQNEEILFKLVGVYAILNDTSSIKNILENSKNINGCTLKTCILLAKIYNDKGNSKALQEIYIELYNITKNKSFILALIELLSSQNKDKEALHFALKYNADDDMKLYLYQRLKLYNKAKDLSMQIYKRTQEKEYLLRAAVFEFEEANLNKKITPQVVALVSEKFSNAIDENSDALYLNYYGYLLIDYDLDLKKGMKLVELALKKEPQNLYYLDSLAWGYYKQGDCKKAWEILKQTLEDKEFANSDESKAHAKVIKACIKP